jgi:hypothetical protein
MTKQTGNYESLIRGVSEQVAHQRYPGQHWAQDNMVSDPVRGLVRRAGSVKKDELLTTATLSPATEADLEDYREHSLYLGNTEYGFMFRHGAKPVGSTAPGIIAVDKTLRKFMPVQISGGDATMAAVLDTGISSVTSAGRFILMAAKQVPTTYSDATPWEADNRGVAVVKGGNYSRTYTLKATHTNGNSYTGIYTTPTSYYPGVLDTSDILTSNPDYNKMVNDRIYAYQTAVNQWIGSSAAAIVPASIAANLRNALVANGFPSSDAANLGADGTIVFVNITKLSITDSSDGSQVDAVFREVDSINNLSVYHIPGKVVKVSPRLTSGGDQKSFYVKARAVPEAVPVGGGWTRVIWEETAGTVVTPGFVTLVGTIVSGTLYMASSATILQSIAGVSPPSWATSSSGDYDSQPLPNMFGKTINYLRVFQDRLMVVAGSTVLLSRSGDYFNFFKSSALITANDDPIEVFALGSEDDVITDGALLDRDLLLFGNVWQYAISGREAMLPQNPYMAIQSSYADSNRCPPVSAGNLVFYTQPRDHKLTLQQMQTGAYAGTVATFEVTQQLSKYLQGSPKGLVATTSPSAIFVRTDGLKNGVYVFSYLDAPGQTERLFDSWSRWTWDENMGVLAGITGKDGAMMTVTLRQGTAGTYLVLDEFSLNASLSTLPYLDSMRVLGTPGTLTPDLYGDICAVAMDATADEFFLIGRSYAMVNQLTAEFPDDVGSMQLGFNYDSAVVLTNPYMRDSDGKAILDGRLTLGTLVVTLVDSAAVKARTLDLETLDQTEVEVLNWVARPAGAWVLNRQQIEESANITVGVYKEIRNVKVKLHSRSWLPFGLSAIEWSGQFFTRRA